MSDFRKEITCPSSWELVELLEGEIAGENGLRIAVHLAGCEFCEAELEFYRAFPPTVSETIAPAMPALARAGRGLDRKRDYPYLAAGIPVRVLSYSSEL